MGFREKWIGWIRHGISSLSFAVLVNGSPTDFFLAFRGLRQGDPLSRLLFLLVMDAFTRMIESTSDAGLICRFSVSRSSMTTLKVSRLFGADTIVFCDNDCEQMVNL